MWTVTEFPERARKVPPVKTIQGETMIVSAHREGRASAAGSRTCHHFPPCPAATASDRHAARTVAAHPEQGWSLLCNRVVLFDDNGELLPDGCGSTSLPGVITRTHTEGGGPPRTRQPECNAAA
jgi:hypothetical protein